jgi:hypothetical protein
MDSIRQSIPAFGLMEYTVTWDNLSQNNSNNDNNNNNSGSSSSSIVKIVVV